MQAGCIHCGQQHLLNDAVLAKHSKVQFRCTKCGKTTIVEVKRRADETVVISPMPSFARADVSTASMKAAAVADEPNPDLPPGVSVTLAITSGPELGRSITLSKARAIVGRKGADIALTDPEVSRHHCVLEVRDGFVNLKDLDSTNGTFFEEERVRAAVLQNGTEFRVGSTIIHVTFHSQK